MASAAITPISPSIPPHSLVNNGCLDVSHLAAHIPHHANDASPLDDLRMTAIESGSSSKTFRAAEGAGLTPTKKSYIHYYDKATKQLWKISIQQVTEITSSKQMRFYREQKMS